MSQTIDRRDFLKATAAASTLPLAWQGRVSGDESRQRRPNLLFVLADQWRFSAFGHGSDEVVRTPHIDRLASEGTLFQRAYAANPVCTPNRSCILTGRYSHQHGMINNNRMLPPSEICWPEMFQQAGYATHYIGKWHMDGPAKPGFVPPGWRRRGLTTFEGFNRGHVYHRHWGFDNEGQPLPWEKGGEPYYEPTLQTNLAIDFIKKHRDNPFACCVSWGPPHTPFNPPDDFEKYAAEQIKLRPNVPEAHKQRAIKDLVGYYGLCESLDHEMGRLVATLKEQNLLENTLIVFTSDHGELAGSHGKYRKGEPEDESLHVPLVMHMPGHVAKQENSTLINSIDLMPTMLSLCGLPTPKTCEGRDLSAVARDAQGAPSVETVFCEGKVQVPPNRGARRKKGRRPNRGSWRTIVTETHKLTVRRDWDNVESLYNLEDDPFELENRANETASAKVRKELLAELKDWSKRTGDTFPNVPEGAKGMYTDEEAAQARG